MKANFEDVYQRACIDKKFLATLLRSPEEALATAQLELPALERQELKNLLKKTKKISFEEVLQFANELLSSRPQEPPPPPPPPPPVWFDPRGDKKKKDKKRKKDKKKGKKRKKGKKGKKGKK